MPGRLIAAGAVVSIAVVVALSLAVPALRADVWGQSLAEAGGLAACAVAAAHTHRRARLVWILFAGGLAIWALTDGAYAAALVAEVDVPEVSAFDIGWLLFYLPMLWAVLLLYRHLRPERGWQGVIDALIGTVTLSATAWIVVVKPLARSGSGGVTGTLVGGLYPALDLICLAALGWIIARHGRRSPAWLRWVVLALAMQASAGLAYLISALHGHDLALTSAVAYVAAGWCWIQAGAVRLRVPERTWTTGAYDHPPAWSETVPFVLGAAVIVVGVIRSDPELRAAAMVTAVLVAVRAIGALRLNRGLIAERDRLLVTDPLTGAYNRRFLELEAGRALARAGRGDENISAIALDLDRFKEVNDRLGHGAGDEVLRAVSDAAVRELRMGDLLCRLGGDEFLVLCPATGAPGAAAMAERLRRAVARAAQAAVPEIPVTASLGVATIPDDAADADELLRRADEALYAAKDAGRDRVVAYAERRAGLGAASALVDSSVPGPAPARA